MHTKTYPAPGLISADPCETTAFWQCATTGYEWNW